MEGLEVFLTLCLLVYWRCTLGIGGGPCAITCLRRRQLILPVVNWDISLPTALVMWILRKLLIMYYSIQQFKFSSGIYTYSDKDTLVGNMQLYCLSSIQYKKGWRISIILILLIEVLLWWEVKIIQWPKEDY